MYFGDILTAMVTPFKEDGAVNFEKAEELACHLADNGTDGLVIGGTTGESPSLTRDEMIGLATAVKKAVGSKAKVILGAGGNCTAKVVENINEFNKYGLDGYLSVVPYYNKPTQEGVYQHYEAINAVSDCPVIVYNIPGRTGINLQPDTVARIANLDAMGALKESTGNVDQATQILMRVPDDFSVYSGDDYMTLPLLALGCAGVVSVASHIAGNEMKEMIKAAKSGDLKTAREINKKLYPLFKGLFVTTNPIPTKTALNLMGFNLGGFRLPITDPTEEETEFIKNLLKEYGKIS